MSFGETICETRKLSPIYRSPDQDKHGPGSFTRLHLAGSRQDGLRRLASCVWPRGAPPPAPIVLQGSLASCSAAGFQAPVNTSRRTKAEASILGASHWLHSAVHSQSRAQPSFKGRGEKSHLCLHGRNKKMQPSLIPHICARRRGTICGQDGGLFMVPNLLLSSQCEDYPAPLPCVMQALGGGVCTSPPTHVTCSSQ